MSIERDQFVVDIADYGKEYTPKQVADYIARSITAQYADRRELQELIQRSQTELDRLVEEHQVPMEKTLNSSSDVGKLIAALALTHCDDTIYLIIEGGISRGMLI